MSNNIIHNDHSSFWNEVFSTIRSLMKPLIWLAVGIWIIPELLTNILPAVFLSGYVDSIRQFAEASDGHADLFQLIALANRPFYLLLASVSTSLFLLLFGYFSVLQLSLDFFEDKRTTDWGGLLGQAFFNTLRYGVGLFLISLLLFVALQSLLPFLTFVLLPLILAPVIAVKERRGVFSTLYRTLSVQIVTQQRFIIFMQICGIGALFYLGHLLNTGLFMWMNDFDVLFSIPSRWLLIQLGPAQLSWTYLLGLVCETIVRAGLLAVMIVSSLSLYMRLSKLRRLLANFEKVV